MSILTRLTKEAATLLLPQSKYASSFHKSESGGGIPAAYLTFDDGPHLERTPKTLDQLDKLGIKATFFMLGLQAEKHPELVHEVHARGHVIGSHSWNHLSAIKTSSKEWYSDALKGRQAIEEIIGEPCPLFRPPYGDLTPSTLVKLIVGGFHIIMWTQDTEDFRAKTEHDFCQWFETTAPTAGTVVLLHDRQAITSEHLYQGCVHWLSQVEFRTITDG